MNSLKKKGINWLAGTEYVMHLPDEVKMDQNWALCVEYNFSRGSYFCIPQIQ